MSTPPPKRYGEVAPWPPEGALDLPTLVPGSGPMEIDVGFGRGLSVFERASEAPGSRILGIEIKPKWAHLVDLRRAKAGLERVVIFCGDAREILQRSGPPGCVDRVFLHFPDPWWKKRHRKRRVVAAGLLDTLARLMRQGGALYVQTDVEARAREYLRLIGAHGSFSVDDGGLLADKPFAARSNRERRAALDGLPVYRVLALRDREA